MSDTDVTTVSLTGPERDIVIASLRHWQQSANINADCFDIAENGRGSFVSDMKIDDLIEEKLNT